MATIFEKIPASGEKCLILEPKEALVYPFNLGDWSEIRISMAISFTQPENDNSFIQEEYLPASSSNKNSMYIGLYSGDGNLPFSTGSAFIGFGNKTGAAIYMTSNAFSVGSPCYAGIAIGNKGLAGGGFDGSSISGISAVGTNGVFGGYGTSAVSATNTFHLSSGLAPTGSYLIASGETNYCAIQSMQFNINNKDLAGQSVSLRWRNNGPGSTFTDTSIDKLKILNANTSASSAMPSIYFNSDQSSTGSPHSIPNKILIYFPFIRNRARIHSILVEKYA